MKRKKRSWKSRLLAWGQVAAGVTSTLALGTEVVDRVRTWLEPAKPVVMAMSKALPEMARPGGPVTTAAPEAVHAVPAYPTLLLVGAVALSVVLGLHLLWRRLPEEPPVQ